VNSQPAKRGDKLTKYKEKLVITATTEKGKMNFANLDLRAKGAKPVWIRATAKNGSRTTYQIPCQLKEDKYSEAEITWSNGKNSSCGEGIRVTSNSKKIGYYPNKKSIQIAKVKSLDMAQAPAEMNYYCSSVPNKSSLGYFGIGTSSTEDACIQAQKKCISVHNDCSIATMGEWDLNDSDLKMSFECYDGRQKSFNLLTGRLILEGLQGLGGSIIVPPKVSNDTIDIILGGAALLFGNPCYLQVYHSDEILISPDKNQLTTVNAYESDGGIKVNVLKGDVKLHSTENPDGILASEGKEYFFDGSGSIRPMRQGLTIR
jgi:hypothetical protein